ncbi:MAG: hypothetical protein QY332_11870 [Anaerolineales bacterium]|nr:MAG: hypothetical protein QY332_11870 [Anaerolineales bacterium]
MITLIFVGAGILLSGPDSFPVHAQQPTGSVPTVTGTPSGMIVAVNLDIDTVAVYSGPSSYLYPAIGLLLKGQEVPALGISEDRNWIQVYYPGVSGSVAWVYGPYVRIVKTGQLPMVSAPATPTPASTPTINPTLAAAFVTPVTPTRMPTFTPPAPLVISTFLADETTINRVPMGLLIFGLGFIGAFGALISFLRGQ